MASMTMNRNIQRYPFTTEDVPEARTLIHRVLLSQPAVPQHSVHAGIQTPNQPDPTAFRQFKAPAGRHVYAPPDVIERHVNFDFFELAYVSGAATIQTTRELALIPEGLFRGAERVPAALAHGHTALLQLVTAQAPVQRIPGLALVISSPWNNYWHWLIEHLPKIVLLMHLDQGLFKECSFIVEPEFPQWKRDILLAIGVSTHQIVEPPGGVVSLQPDILVVPTYPQPNAVVMREISERLLAAGKAPSIDMGSGLIYIQRGAEWGKRTLLNEVDVAARLSKQGFQVIQADKYTPMEQAHIFSKAKMIVSIHSSSLTNIFHAPDSAKIVELYGARVGLAFRQLAYEMLQEHVMLFGDVSSPSRYIHGNPSKSDVTINVAELLNTLHHKYDVRLSMGEPQQVADSIYNNNWQKNCEINGVLNSLSGEELLKKPRLQRTLCFQILNIPGQQFEKTRYFYSHHHEPTALERLFDGKGTYEALVKRSREQGFTQVTYRQKELNRALIDTFNNLLSLKIEGVSFSEFLSEDNISLWQFVMPAVYNGPCKEVFEVIEYLGTLVEEHQPDLVVIMGNLHDYQEQAATHLLSRRGVACQTVKVELEVGPAEAPAPQAVDEYTRRIEAGERAAIGKYAAGLQDGKEFRDSVLMVSYPSAWQKSSQGEIDRYYQAFKPELESRGVTGVRVELPHYFLINDSKQAYLEQTIAGRRGGYDTVFLDAYLRDDDFSRCPEWRRLLIAKFERLTSDNDFLAAFCYRGESFFIPLFEYWQQLFTEYLVRDCLPTLFIARRMLKQIRPKALLLTYEAGQYSRALVIEAHRLGTPSFALQHAMISDQFKCYTDQGVCNAPDLSSGCYGFIVPGTTFVWGSYHKEILTTKGSYPEEAVVCVGNWMAPSREKILDALTPLGLLNLRKSWFASQRRIALLLTAVSAYGVMDQIAAKLDPDKFCLLIKPHPQEKNGPAYLEYFRRHGFETTLINGYLQEAILLAELVIADLYSTTVGDCLLFGKPTYAYCDREMGWSPPWEGLVFNLEQEERLEAHPLPPEKQDAIVTFLEAQGLCPEMPPATAIFARISAASSQNVADPPRQVAPIASPIRLYAGDVPTMPEYDGWLGLSLTQNDHRHLLQDITKSLPFPDNSVDAFQAEDVLEHIPYDRLVPVINEIFRVLKPGALFRLSVPDYGCDVLRKRSIKSPDGDIIFDPGGGGTPGNPGHLWFPTIERVYRLLEATKFYTNGTMDFLHYWNGGRHGFVARQIDYSKGFIKRTPDHDERVNNPYRPMSIVVDLYKTA